jgi:hypothetical protein
VPEAGQGHRLNQQAQSGNTNNSLLKRTTSVALQWRR